MKHLLVLLMLSGVIGCGDDPVSFSAPVGINLKAKSGEVVNNAISNDKGINTESGNPFGAFVGPEAPTIEARTVPFGGSPSALVCDATLEGA